MYLLDATFCIQVVQKRPPKLLERLSACQPDEVGLSIVTLSELAYDVAGGQAREKNRQALELFLTAVPVIEFPAEAAFIYAEVRVELEKKGTSLGAMDLMTAAHALATGSTLVSNKTRELRRIPGLLVENWERRA